MRKCKCGGYLYTEVNPFRRKVDDSGSFTMVMTYPTMYPTAIGKCTGCKEEHTPIELLV